jgi:Calponin homology (CH) domain
MGDSAPQRRFTGLHELFHQRQLEVKMWIEEVIGERLIIGDNLGSAMKDGKLLCRLINTLYPGYIDKWCDVEPIPKHKMIENINIFLHKCRLVINPPQTNSQSSITTTPHHITTHVTATLPTPPSTHPPVTP